MKQMLIQTLPTGDNVLQPLGRRREDGHELVHRSYRRKREGVQHGQPGERCGASFPTHAGTDEIDICAVHR